ncbi:MAG: hypothetical protein IT577_00875 [Verrucomicrobiae bacterium]|nr:hypothetical protein [Verrucomicrobiae bacterium]
MDGANEKGGWAGLLQVPLLTRRRIALAFVAAAAADIIQWMFAGTTLLPLWFDDAVDLVAMVALWRLLGFHLLLLPAFLAEVLPGVEMLPTWLGVVAYLVRVRSKEQRIEDVQGK